MSFHHETVLFTPSVFPPLSHCHEMLKPHQVPVIRLAAPHVFAKPGDACRIDFKDLEADVNLYRLPQVKMADHEKSTGISVSHVKAEPSPLLNVVRAAVVKDEPHEEKPKTENVAQQQMWHACSRRNDSEESVATSPRVPPLTTAQARCELLRKPDADGEVENSEVQSKKDWKELGKTWKEKEEPECEPVSSLHSQEPSSIDEAAIWVPFAPTVSEVTRKPSEQRFSQQRSCSSCQTRKTPLWRDGPEGPKTLCNACGLRHQRGRTDGKYYKRKTSKDSKKTKKAASATIPAHIAREAWREDSDNARSDSGVSTKEVSGITAVSSGTVPASRCVQAVRSSPLSSNNAASGQSADKSWKRVNRPTQKALESKLGGEFRRIGSLGSASHAWTTTHQCYRCMKQTKFQLKDGPDGANTLCNACHKRVTEAERSPPPSSGDESEDVDLRGEADEVEMEVEDDGLEEKVEEVVLTGWGAVHKRKRMMCTAENSPVVRRRYFGSFPISPDCCGNSSPCESDDAVGMESGAKADMGEVSPMVVREEGGGEDKAMSRSGSAVDLTRLSKPPSCEDAGRISVQVLEEKLLAETDEMMGWKHGQRVPMKVPRPDLNSKHFPEKRIKLIYGGGKVRPMKRCICCSAEDTPQWREGPKGPKTLCNACGLRFAKGRVCNHHRASKSSSGLKKLKLSVMSVDKVEEEEHGGEREREFVPRDDVQGLGLEVEGKRRRKKINRAALDEEMERGSDREARKKSKKAKRNKKAEKSVKKANRAAADGWSFKAEKWGREAGVNFVLGDDPSFTPVGLDGDKRGMVPQIRRRCTHCFQDRTPLWREGPLGPKTLCNACGIMHKRGRLDPSKCHPVSEMDGDMPIMAVDFHRGKGKGGSCGGKSGAPKKPRAVKEAGAVKPKKPRAKKVDKEGKSQRPRQHSHTSGLSMIPMDIGLDDWASEGLGELDNLESQRLCAKLGSETESDEEDYPKLAGRTGKGWVGGKPREKAAAGTNDCWSSEEALNRLFAQDSFDADEEGLLDDLPEVHELLDGDDMNGLANIEFPWIFGDPLDNLDTVTQCDVENWEVTENWLLTERPAVQAAKA